MDELFDDLAKDAARGVSRRQMFRRFGWGVAAALVGGLGRTRVEADSCVPKCCVTFCQSADLPPGNDRGKCISDCMRGVAGTQGGFVRTVCEQQCAG